MKLLVVNPNTCAEMTESIRQVAQAAAGQGTEVIAVSPAAGPVSVETYYDEAFSAAEVIKTVREYKDRVDAVVVACFNDPALYALRELCSIPVVGIAQSAMLLSSLVAHKFSLVSLFPRDKILLEELLWRYGMAEKCASIRITGLSVLDCEQHPEKTDAAMKEAGRLAVQQDGAEALIVGCAGMAAFAAELQNELHVPVIDGVGAAVKLAESLVSLGLTTSKACSFDYPLPKAYPGMPQQEYKPEK